MSKSLSYRPDIDGLRAIAVVAVILFHLIPSGVLEGGFLGVDVFFVISGYLITTIITGQIQKGSFSFLEFWKRRIRRLYPVLLLIVAVAMCLGAFLQIQPERGNLPQQALAAIFSYQNINLWLTTGGYWARASENILLLHTWSLSLEEQFYIIFPFILFAIARWGRGRDFMILGALMLASFAYCIYATPRWPTGAFYLLPTRMWELMFGSLLAIRHLQKGNRTTSRYAPLLQIIGLTLIIGSFFQIKHNETFPGYLPIFPCFGALLIIGYGSARGIVNRLLTLKPIVYIGKISYSLYLWHWVIIVAVRYASPEKNYAFILALTFICAVLSYHFVENPFRYGLKRPALTLPLAGTALAALAAPLFLLPASPIIRNVKVLEDKRAQHIPRQYEGYRAFRRGAPGFWINESPEIDIYVLGSSHALAWCQPIADYAEANNLTALLTATSQMGILGLNQELPDGSPRQDFPRLHRKRLAHLLYTEPKLVIVAGRWSVEQTITPNFYREFAEQLTMISLHSGQVLVLSEVPTVDIPREHNRALPKYLIACGFADTIDSIKSRQRTIDSNRTMESLIEALDLPNVTYLKTEEVFTRDTGHMKLFDENQLLYLDDNHINLSGATLGFQTLLKGHFDTHLTPRAEKPIPPVKPVPAKAKTKRAKEKKPKKRSGKRDSDKKKDRKKKDRDKKERSKKEAAVPAATASPTEAQAATAP